MPTAKRGVYACGGGDLQGLAGQEWCYGKMPCGACAEVKQVGYPAGAHREENDAGGGSCEECGGEVRMAEADGSDYAACRCGCEREGEEESGGGAG